MKVLVIGGGGYVGSMLCPELTAEGHSVTALDTFWYGKHVLPHSVTKVEVDMRDIPRLREALHGQDAVIHLACISNDPSFDMNPALSQSINLDCFADVIAEVRLAKVKRFIYASSSSVYGIKEGQVTEETACDPLTDYSRCKLACEKILADTHMLDTAWTVLRPATVCGAAPRLRLDLIVNALTASALANRKITVHGGSQLRPNLHIKDMVRAYRTVLSAEVGSVHRKTFNVGGPNFSVEYLANKIADAVRDPELAITYTETNDLRSYHINSDLIHRTLNFKPDYGIEDAVWDLAALFPHLVYPMMNSSYYNIKRMKELGL